MKKVRLCLISGSQARAPLVSQERQISRANIYYKSEITEVIEYLLQMREIIIIIIIIITNLFTVGKKRSSKIN